MPRQDGGSREGENPASGSLTKLRTRLRTKPVNWSLEDPESHTCCATSSLTIGRIVGIEK